MEREYEKAYERWVLTELTRSLHARCDDCARLYAAAFRAWHAAGGCMHTQASILLAQVAAELGVLSSNCVSTLEDAHNLHTLRSCLLSIMQEPILEYRQLVRDKIKISGPVWAILGRVDEWNEEIEQWVPDRFCYELSPYLFPERLTGHIRHIASGLSQVPLGEITGELFQRTVQRCIDGECQ